MRGVWVEMFDSETLRQLYAHRVDILPRVGEHIMTPTALAAKQRYSFVVTHVSHRFHADGDVEYHILMKRHEPEATGSDSRSEGSTE